MSSTSEIRLPYGEPAEVTKAAQFCAALIIQGVLFTASVDGQQLVVIPTGGF